MSETEHPIDESRKTRPRDGMVFKDRREAPGLAMLVMAALALVGFLCAAALHDAGWSLGFGILVLVLAAGGVTWVFVGRNRSFRGGNHRRQT
ncbi:hypothetical protein [Mycolicibacter kumamotonensis]|uniref:hypothetical protein n=1 Tax=Mycolicibacter kumamotonensis TaxID=354243 RepID=UPI0009F58328|nr:hypothetical protein [Mycolicibacter kumamotonensis]